jgi:OOP family OmpA-OmpF porin
MKKIIIVMLCMALTAVMIPSAFGVELSREAVEAKRVPASYATIKGGDIVFGKSATAYSPDTLDRILTAYDLTLSTDAQLPSGYATVKDGNVAFKKGATAFSPDVTHQILTAYGLTLSADDASTLKDPANYVKVKDGNLVFGKSPTAYSPEEFNMLMGAYKAQYTPPPITTPTPTPKEEEVITPGPTPTPTPTPVPEGCPDADKDGICDDRDQCPGTPIGARVDERGCWIIENLLFDFDKSVIKSKYYPDLDDVVRVMQENPDLRVEIQGHTCNIGTEKYNQGLSERRAKSVLKYLKDHGIQAERLSWKGFGESQPAFPNTSRENRVKNRRVELKP